MVRRMAIAFLVVLLVAGLALAQRGENSPTPVPDTKFPDWPAAQHEVLDCKGPFTRVVMRGGFDLYVAIGPEYTCAAESMPHYKHKIEFYVKDGVLYLEPERKVVNWVRPRRVLVTAPVIEGIALQGSGNVHFKGKNGGPLALVIDGSGDMAVEGKADGLAVEVKGTGDCIGKDFRAGPAEIRVSGSGNVELAGITESLNLNVRGSGDVEIDHAEVETAEIHLRGAGKAEVAGTTNRLDVEMKGSADLEARNFIAQVADITIKGSGDARIRIEQALTADVQGSGDLTYYGDPPKVKLSNAGSGEIEKGE